MLANEVRAIAIHLSTQVENIVAHRLIGDDAASLLDGATETFRAMSRRLLEIEGRLARIEEEGAVR